MCRGPLVLFLGWCLLAQPGLAINSCTGPLCRTCDGPLTVDDLQNKLWGPGTGYGRRTQPNAAWAAAAARAGNHSVQVETDPFYFNIQWLGILEVNERLQTFVADIWTREVWMDWRLRFNSTEELRCLKSGRIIGPVRGLEDSAVWVYMPLEDLQQNIWMPAVEFQTLVDEPEVIWARSWILSDGHVWITKRQVMKFSCKMVFEKMPFDLQSCGLPVQPALVDNIALVPGIKDGKPLTITPSEGVYLGGVVDWTLDEEKTNAATVCEFNGRADGKCDSFLKYTFVLKRDPSYYTLYFVAPMCHCVAIAWCSFIISRSAAPARVCLTAVTFLTLLGTINAILAQLPPLPGKVWLLDFQYVSMYFCLYANIEYAFANFLMRAEQRIESIRDDILREMMERDRVDADNSPDNPQEEEKPLRRKIQARAGRCDRLLVSWSGSVLVHDQHLDIFSRWAYPAAYAIVLAVFYARTY